MTTETGLGGGRLTAFVGSGARSLGPRNSLVGYHWSYLGSGLGLRVES